MAEFGDVINYLRPEGGWVARGGTYEGIEFMECKPFTKEEFEAAFAKYDVWKADQEAQAAAAKQALLDRLGITADEAKLLLS